VEKYRDLLPRGVWSEEEHAKYVELIGKHGKNFRLITKCLGSKTY